MVEPMRAQLDKQKLVRFEQTKCSFCIKSYPKMFPAAFCLFFPKKISLLLAGLVFYVRFGYGTEWQIITLILGVCCYTKINKRNLIMISSIPEKLLSTRKTFFRSTKSSSCSTCSFNIL